LSNYSSSENLSNKTRTSINLGAIAEYYFNDRWSFRSGLLYDSKGTRLSGRQFGGEFVDKLNYLAIPLHANWHFGRNRGWFLNFGPTLGFLLSAKADTPSGEIDIKDALESTFDFGLSLGIGYKFMTSEKSYLFLQYQGFGGFIPVFQDPTTGIRLTNSTSAFNIGVVIDL
jgi:outer membrane protein W